MSADFSPCDNANAFIANELSAVERSDFEAHLVNCGRCQHEVKSTRILFGRLSAIPAEQASRDLEPSVFARLREEMPTAPPRHSWIRFAAIAATVAIMATGVAFLVKSNEHRLVHEAVASSAAQGLDWLARAQEPDGSWNPERWGGERKFGPALCGLPLMALVGAQEPTPEQKGAAARATGYLLHQKNPDGTFGGVFQGAPYNHSIATLALLHAWERDPDTVPKATLDSAIGALTRSQTAEGGWGYIYSPLPDRSITQWHVKALETAARLGWKNARESANRGVHWLQKSSDPDAERFEAAEATRVVLAKATESSTVNPDSPGLYQAYFTIDALQADPNAHARVTALQKNILQRQESTGDIRGSWAPDDQWGRAGGRLYSTSLACLSILSHQHTTSVAKAAPSTAPMMASSTAQPQFLAGESF